MLSAKIAELKAKLSFYLNHVKQGQEVLVYDRNTPVAKMVPSQGQGREISILTAKKHPSALRTLKIRSLKRKTDAVGLLRGDRDRR